MSSRVDFTRFWRCRCEKSLQNLRFLFRNCRLQMMFYLVISLMTILFLQFFLTVDGKIHKFYTNTSTNERVDIMIMHLVTAIKSIFPAVPFEYEILPFPGRYLPLRNYMVWFGFHRRIVRKVDLLPPERLLNIQTILESLETRDCGPCGGYSRMYACMCDYHCLPYREEVAWDVDTIYHSHNTREFCLQDFDHLEPRYVPGLA